MQAIKGLPGHQLLLDASAEQTGEQTILGGLKTKNVDVVVSTRELGPCLAVSVKGSLNAFRNLTNRMEEAAGDCTNLHIAYPTLVYGFLHFIKGNREGDVQKRNDIAILSNNEVSTGIVRYHDAMARLSGRRDVRNETSRYESIALSIVDTSQGSYAEMIDWFPSAASPLRFDRFFDTLYATYDLRFVYAAPAMMAKTHRLQWHVDSPALELAKAKGFRPRVAD